jgi:hypothetical protein
MLAGGSEGYFFKRRVFLPAFCKSVSYRKGAEHGLATKRHRCSEEETETFQAQ